MLGVWRSLLSNSLPMRRAGSRTHLGFLQVLRGSTWEVASDLLKCADKNLTGRHSQNHPYPSQKGVWVMRTGLIPHLGQQVLCKGWIASWKDLEGLSTRQVVVKNPTIRKADRNLRFEKQTLLTKEDHLNLFIEHKDLPNYDATFQLHASIQFSGVVRLCEVYGSTDLGSMRRQSTLPLRSKGLSCCWESYGGNLIGAVVPSTSSESRATA